MIMALSGRSWVIFFLAALLLSGCLNTPVIDREKAGYIAGIKFLETHPGETATFNAKDPGGDAYLVYFNITDESGMYKGFAEYFVDKQTKDVYVSSRYAALQAVEENEDLKKIFERYPSARFEGELFKDKVEEDYRYVWDIKVVANSVRIADIKFDAKNEELLSADIVNYIRVEIQTGK